MALWGRVCHFGVLRALANERNGTPLATNSITLGMQHKNPGARDTRSRSKARGSGAKRFDAKRARKHTQPYHNSYTASVQPNPRNQQPTMRQRGRPSMRANQLEPSAAPLGMARIATASAIPTTQGQRLKRIPLKGNHGFACLGNKNMQRKALAGTLDYPVVAQEAGELQSKARVHRATIAYGLKIERKSQPKATTLRV
ncbi:hypothetical protein FNV43_RR20888 [Rhamnella rubrinervis]|uniref:Uncharacterized protein n=1 Tax=Rhamnella rubrinervis TaxID=2594499 RepID=A0A8K0GQW8_9ROSA|nr:hypothetical protein FNV43_RR20888 [Rhamnella rubrinervis]